MKSWIFFDLDGTLTDPGEGITNSVMYALEKYGIRVKSREELYPFIGPPLTESFQVYYGFSVRESFEAMAYYREYFSVKGLFENKVYPGIPEMLSALKAAGKKLAVATSKPEEYSRRILEKYGLWQYFDFLAGNTLLEDRPTKKSVLEYAFSSLNLSPGNVVMVGDRKYDMEGAKAFSMTAVGVSYGYGSTKELCDAGADLVCATVEELGDTLLRLT